jgi:isopentenyldiphosphate isomerase
MTNPAEEPVDIIDAAGRTVGVTTRREMRAQRLPHRCVYVLVFNSQGQVFLHLRTATKDVFPSHWDLAVGGVLAAGETFAQGAAREVDEELGVSGHLEELFPFRYEDERTVVQAMVYLLRHDGPFQLQQEEIVRGEFVAPEGIGVRAQKDPFCPDGLRVWEEFRKMFGLPTTRAGASG